MTVKLISPWGIYAAGAIVGTLSTADEQRLIAAHLAMAWPPVAADPAQMVRTPAGQVGIVLA